MQNITFKVCCSRIINVCELIEGVAGVATPVAKRRPPPAIIPTPQIATSTPTGEGISPIAADESQTKPKGKRGRKRVLEVEKDAVTDAAVDAASTKRPRRTIKAPTPADAEVSFAKNTRSSRRA